MIQENIDISMTLENVKDNSMKWLVLYWSFMNVVFTCLYSYFQINIHI